MIALLFALVLATTELPAPEPAPFVTQPVWLKRPNGEDLARYRPEDARVSGRAVIECEVSGRGLLQYCRVLEETPGEQYGKAALAIAAKFRMGPQDKAGSPTVGRKVRIPLAWSLPTVAASAADRPPPTIDGLPRWRALPSGQDFLRAYPRQALRDGLAGRAVISCGVLASGLLSDCSVTEETPSGSGFGSASLSLAPMFRLSPVDREGKSVEGAVVRIPLVWNPPPSD